MKKLLKIFGIGVALSGSANTEVDHSPYKSSESNFMYNLLFCDVPTLFHREEAGFDTKWQEVLFGSESPEKVRAIAENDGEESRVKILAYNWLRQRNHPVPIKQLYGVVVEVPLDEGLDTLAAYEDGRARYINQTGKISVVEEGVPEINALASELVQVAAPLLSQIGPWEQKRLPPPRAGNIRLTFLASDGLYFGEGPIGAMQQDSIAGPIISKAVELLQTVVNASFEPST